MSDASTIETNTSEATMSDHDHSFDAKKIFYTLFIFHSIQCRSFAGLSYALLCTVLQFAMDVFALKLIKTNSYIP